MSSSLAEDEGRDGSDTAVEKQVVPKRDRPVGFLDLPLEVRTMVYEKHLAEAYPRASLQLDVARGLEIQQGRSFVARFSTKSGTRERQRGRPSLLLVSGLIRSEALPIYTSKLTVTVFGDLGRQDEIRDALAQYLQNSRSLFVYLSNDDTSLASLNLPSMPALRVLHFSHDITTSFIDREYQAAFEKNRQRLKKLATDALKASALPPGVRVYTAVSGRGAYVGRVGLK
ncbi:uncharacterized protein AB675_7669 [Cyphellophora attinorum]|uniref:Uncharacterized protein n=1 Tax=Cyphellophora attinorum TaxID=1664694 RepID=A0A0N1HU30_9EURO|nr:uncharacterized protein AB675_7669 [Phialophora attinorum]KPI40245.1 hypothetical protein AB675_7669 [Phialophora attinorum]